MFKATLKVPFWLMTVIGFGAGVGVALLFGENALPLFDLIGTIFIKLIKMLVVPLVFFTVASSLGRLGQGDSEDQSSVAVKALGLGLHTLALFVVTSVFAVFVGLIVGLIFQPGVNVDILPSQQITPANVPTLNDIIIGLVPTNILASFAEGKVLSVIIVALLVGAATVALKRRVGLLSNVLEQGSLLMFRITGWVIKLTPIGVFGLIGSVVARYGLASLTPLLGFIGCIFLGCFIQLLLVYPALLRLHGLSVFGFYRSIFAAQQTAFFTCSSIATLPVSLQAAIDNLKLNRSYASFALPLGATMKMDACGAIYPVISCIFIANYFGIHLTSTHFISIALSSVLGSFAIAGVPGVAVVMLSLTLSAAGLPLEGVALLAGIDRILDMIRTATNVTGQIVVPSLVSKVHGLIDRESPLLKG